MKRHRQGGRERGGIIVDSAKKRPDWGYGNDEYAESMGGGGSGQRKRKKGKRVTPKNKKIALDLDVADR
jgi:hypothetical protein